MIQFNNSISVSELIEMTKMLQCIIKLKKDHINIMGKESKYLYMNSKQLNEKSLQNILTISDNGVNYIQGLEIMTDESCEDDCFYVGVAQAKKPLENGVLNEWVESS